MPRLPNYQHIPYVPDHERPLWEVIVDTFFPPIRFPDGRRFDEDYVERFYFHVFGVGGPCAPYEERYQPHELTIYAVVDYLEERKQRIRERWLKVKETCQSRLGGASEWLDAKLGWRRMARVASCGMVGRHDDEDDHNDDYDRLPFFDPGSRSPTERTRLLRHASWYSAISTQPELDDDDCLQDQDEDAETESPVPTSSGSSPRGRRPSALSGSRQRFLKKLKLWARRSPPKSVRFSGVHDVMVYDKLPGEPSGCYKPDYSHLIAAQQDPQLDVIVQFLHAASSASRSNPPSLFSAYGASSQTVACEA